MSKSPIPLIVRRQIPAPRTRIFDAFSRSEALAKWFTPDPGIAIDVLAFDFRTGGRFRFRYTMGDGRQPVVAGAYEIISPPVQIAMSWIWQAPDPLAGVPMRVTFDFLERKGATEVVVTHEGIPSDQACSIHEDGWEATLAMLEVHVCPPVGRP